MIKKIYIFILTIINRIRINRSEHDFIEHNKKLSNQKYHEDNIVLIEMIGLQSNHIAISYLSRILTEMNNAQLIGYKPRLSLSIFNKLKSFIIEKKLKKIFESFGMTKILNIDININSKTLANQLKNKLMSQIKSKSDVHLLTVDNIWVGDLIYDQYLKSNMVPTLDIKSKDFEELMFEFCLLFNYWQGVFSKNKVRALIISHACYFMGLPARIASKFNIQVYQATLENIYCLTKYNLHPSSEFHSYKSDFEKFDIKIKDKAIIRARERLNLIYEGNINVDQPYIKNSAYNQKKPLGKVIHNNKPIKILIAPHCFFDSPNGLGKNLFPDFYEWLDFIAKLSIKTDYEWYIKTHPNTFPENKLVIKDFVSRYPKINFLNDEISHNQLIDEGINIVLTVYGSIGLEYAAKNITVINASQNNPHISFDFNIHPKSKEELKNIILNLHNYVNASLYSDDIYKCYYMKYLHYKEDIFISDYKSVVKHMGGYYDALFTSKIYDFWFNYWSKDIHSHINKTLKEFVLSGEYKMKSKWR